MACTSTDPHPLLTGIILRMLAQRITLQWIALDLRPNRRVARRVVLNVVLQP